MTRLRELLKNATPRPWRIHPWGGEILAESASNDVEADSFTVARPHWEEHNKADFELIVTLVNAASEIAKLMERAQDFAVCQSPYLAIPIEPCGNCSGCSMVEILVALDKKLNT